MTKDTQSFDVLVVGGGPAGMSAAARAAECGKRVGIVDDNFALGGQIYRRHSAGHVESDELNSGDPVHKFMASFGTRPMGVTLLGQRVFHQPEAGVLLAEGMDGVAELKYDKLILATGARERFLPFPGWTLPNVMGAGGLQAMVKSGLPIRGKRVVVAGTGPLLLAVAAYLRTQGAEVALICEQAGWSALAGFAVRMAGFRKKIGEALELRKKLAGIPFAANCWPVEAHGARTLESVTLARGSQRETIACDYLACGFHLVPNVELPLLLGCELSHGCVKVDEFQQTTVPGVFCAGEPTGIGGVESATAEGAIAGLAASGQPPASDSDLFRARSKSRRFAEMMDRAFQLRPELKRLAKDETMVCRCEDVTYARLQAHASWRAAKLHTRCGMGPCQGRVCGPATQFLFGWNADSVRPPVFPARVESLIRR